MLLSFCVLGLGLAAYALAWRRAARARARRPSGARGETGALPGHYATLAALWSGVPVLGLLLLWTPLHELWTQQFILAQLPAETRQLGDGARQLAVDTVLSVAEALRGDGRVSLATDARLATLGRQLADMQARNDGFRSLLAISVAILGLCWGWHLAGRKIRARERVERAARWLMLGCATIAVLTTFGILLSVSFEALRFFAQVSPIDFLFGLEWSPQIAIREGQVGASGAFGVAPVLVGTLMIAGIAMLIAGPVGLLSAIYLAEYAGPRMRAIVKPALEILAGVPTVVYGVFAALAVAPIARELGMSIGWEVSSESALAAGVVMGVMILPFVSSLSNDALNAVPRNLVDGALSLGATRSEAVRQVMVPAALPGIVGGMLLAVSRAIGETMIVVMAAGLAARLTFNPLDASTTVTVQIVTLLIGDQAFDSPKTLAAFALGLMLFVMTLGLNFAALLLVRRYRERYE